MGRFTSLRIGSLLCCIGLGLVVGILLVNLGIVQKENWNAVETVYVACMMLFGGLGMLISFIIEMYMTKKDKQV